MVQLLPSMLRAPVVIPQHSFPHIRNSDVASNLLKTIISVSAHEESANVSEQQKLN